MQSHAERARLPIAIAHVHHRTPLGGDAEQVVDAVAPAQDILLDPEDAHRCEPARLYQDAGAQRLRQFELLEHGHPVPGAGQ